jgi:hypothetical protein
VEGPTLFHLRRMHTLEAPEYLIVIGTEDTSEISRDERSTVAATMITRIRFTRGILVWLYTTPLRKYRIGHYDNCVVSRVVISRCWQPLLNGSVASKKAILTNPSKDVAGATGYSLLYTR